MLGIVCMYDVYYKYNNNVVRKGVIGEANI